MTNAVLERAHSLKQDLVNFVYDAEGAVAEALETYAAEQLKRRKLDPDLLLDCFLTEGQVGDRTPIEVFLAEQADLSEGDRALVQGWQRAFAGLFVVEAIEGDRFELRNWLTTKRYSVRALAPAARTTLSRVKPGEILSARIAPLDDRTWMFSGPQKLLGSLGKPKLAVAIGNFRDNHRPDLYGDAPELEAEAWKSVEIYHEVFVDFFGAEEVTLSGYELNRKMDEFSTLLTQRTLAAAGIDTSKSLDELAAEAGLSEAELVATAEAEGLDPQAVAQALGTQGKPAMKMPKIQLPDELKKAEQVTVLTHPRWGQALLPTYQRFRSLLTTPEEGAERLVRHYLEEPTISVYVWHQLAQEFPQALEALLQTVLANPEFRLDRDLDDLLKAHGKPLEPELPDIASVPVHLHDLFEEALKEVQGSKDAKRNKKGAATAKRGFGG